MRHARSGLERSRSAASLGATFSITPCIMPKTAASAWGPGADWACRARALATGSTGAIGKPWRNAHSAAPGTIPSTLAAMASSPALRSA